MLGPHNFCEPSIIVDLRSEFDVIPEMQGAHGMEKYSRRSSSEEIAFSGVQTKSRRRARRRRKVESFEHLENILSQSKSEAQEEERQWSLDHNAKDRQPSDLSKVHEP
jgi:hypothetical protein